MLSWFLVQEQSMAPLLHEGDFVLGDRTSYVFFKPKVGQIVIARHPARKSMLLVKRIIKERQGLYWIEGDNALASKDSRHFGWVERKDIVGKARVIRKRA
jgi:nickel-type superoxide dismutase maturation protease